MLHKVRESMYGRGNLLVVCGHDTGGKLLVFSAARGIEEDRIVGIECTNHARDVLRGDLRRAIAELEALPLRTDRWEPFLSGNARRVLGLA